MIKEDNNLGYKLICNGCGKRETNSQFIFETYYSVIKWIKKKSNGWISRKVNGGWEDRCPECS